MDQTATGVLNGVTAKTNNDLIFFFVIMAVVIMAVGVPLYTIGIRDRRERRKQQLEREVADRKQQLEKEALQAKREDQYIGVIQRNTEVNSQLKIMLETNNNNCVQCKIEHQQSLADFRTELGEKIDTHNDKIVEVHTLLRTRTCLMLAKEGDGGL